MTKTEKLALKLVVLASEKSYANGGYADITRVNKDSCYTVLKIQMYFEFFRKVASFEVLLGKDDAIDTLNECIEFCNSV